MPKSSSAVRPSGSTNRLPPCRSPWKTPAIIAPSMRATIAGAHDALGVDAGLAHPGHVVELEAVEPLHHEHAPGDELGMRPGDDVAVLVEVAQHRGDVEHVGRLDAEVELLDDRLGEQLDERRRVGQRGDGDAPDEVRRQPRHRPQVVVHEAGDVRSLHLDDDLLAGAQPGRVDLGDRRGGDRRLGELARTRPRAGRRDRPRRCGARPSNVSAGTWSRQRLNSSTSSGGNRPSPEEMIWPSLMNVGPSDSAARRRRRDRSATPAEPAACPRRRRHIHGSTVAASRHVTARPRRPGGSRVGVVSVGTRRRAAWRTRPASPSHVIDSRSSTQGADSEKAPQREIRRCSHRLPSWRSRQASHQASQSG